MIRADVVVLGAGPAGCSAAIICADAGLRTVVVERSPFPRDRPGETLHPGIEPLLRQLGAWDRISAAAYPRHEGISVSWGDRQGFQPYGCDATGPWRGFQAWRADFDTRLLDRGRELGVAVLQPMAARRPLLRAGRISGIATDRAAIQSRFVVDATGGRHWLARRIRLAIDRYGPRRVAWYGYATGTSPDLDAAPAIVADTSGWTWTARVRPALYHWTRLENSDRPLASNWRPTEFAQLSPTCTRRVVDVTWRIARPSAGPGFFLAGDAAFVLDPASSHGVLKAIMSGMLAGNLIVDCMSGTRSESTAVAHYCQEIKSWFDSDRRNLARLYGELSRSARKINDEQSAGGAIAPDYRARTLSRADTDGTKK